ncbi:hypothetical protein D3C78_1166290 [compost metagenome]
MCQLDEITDMTGSPLGRMLGHVGKDVVRAAASDIIEEIFRRPAHRSLPEIGSDSQCRWCRGLRKGEGYD